MKKLNNWDFVHFIAFLAVGIAVFVFGGYLGCLPVKARTAVKATNVLLLGAAVFFLPRVAAWKRYATLAWPFFLVACGFLLAWLARGWPTSLDMDTLRGWTVAKWVEAVPMVLPALVLLPFSGRHAAYVYLRGGWVRRSLLLGLALCLLIALVYGFTSDVFSRMKSLLPVAGWLLCFAVANGFMEELLLRGLFLRPYGHFFSPAVALLLSTLVFTAMHWGASYLSGGKGPMLLAFIFLLGLGNGAIMQRTRSIWGAVLTHAWADCLLLASIFGTAS